MQQFYINYHDGFDMDNLPIEELHTDNIKILYAYIGKQPESPMYGKIIVSVTHHPTPNTQVYLVIKNVLNI